MAVVKSEGVVETREGLESKERRGDARLTGGEEDTTEACASMRHDQEKPYVQGLGFRSMMRAMPAPCATSLRVPHLQAPGYMRASPVSSHCEPHRDHHRTVEQPCLLTIKPLDSRAWSMNQGASKCWVAPPGALSERPSPADRTARAPPAGTRGPRACG